MKTVFNSRILNRLLIAALLTLTSLGNFTGQEFKAYAATTQERISDEEAAGNSAFVNAKYQDALNKFQAAADMLRKSEPNSNTNFKLINCLTKIATCAIELNDHARGKAALLEAINLCNKTRDYSLPDDTSKAVLNLLLREFDREKNTAAIEKVCEQFSAAEFTRSNGNFLDKSDAWLEGVYRSRNMLPQLERHYLSELAKLKEIDSPYLFIQAKAYDSLGKIYQEIRRLPDARNAYINALRLNTSGFNSSTPEQYKHSTEQLIKVEELLHEPEKARQLKIILANFESTKSKKKDAWQGYHGITDRMSNLPPPEQEKKLLEARAYLRQYYFSPVALDAELNCQLAISQLAQGKSKQSKESFDQAIAILDGLDTLGFPKDPYRRLSLTKSYSDALKANGKLSEVAAYSPVLAALNEDKVAYIKSRTRPAAEVTGAVTASLTPATATVFHGDKIMLNVATKNIVNPKLRWSVRTNKGMADARTDRSFGLFALGLQSIPGTDASSCSTGYKRNECEFQAELANSGEFDLVVQVFSDKGTTPLASAAAKIVVPESEISITPSVVKMAAGQKQLFTVVATRVGQGTTLRFDMPRNTGKTGGIEANDPKLEHGKITLTGVYVAPAEPRGPVDVKAMLTNKGLSYPGPYKTVSAKAVLPVPPRLTD